MVPISHHILILIPEGYAIQFVPSIRVDLCLRDNLLGFDSLPKVIAAVLKLTLGTHRISIQVLQISISKIPKSSFFSGSLARLSKIFPHPLSFLNAVNLMSWPVHFLMVSTAVKHIMTSVAFLHGRLFTNEADVLFKLKLSTSFC